LKRAAQTLVLHTGSLHGHFVEVLPEGQPEPATIVQPPAELAQQWMLDAPSIPSRVPSHAE
jgi:hypothetical protein